MPPMPPATVTQQDIGLIHLYFGFKYAIAEMADAFRRTDRTLREEAARVHEPARHAEMQMRCADRTALPGLSSAPLGETPVGAQAKPAGTVSVPSAPNPALLPGALREVWDHLEGNVATAKEMAIAFGLCHAGDVAIVQRVYALRKRGFQIETMRGVGYHRPDAPPRS